MLIGAAYNGRDDLVLCCDHSFRVIIVLEVFFSSLFSLVFFLKWSKIMLFFLFLLSSLFALAVAQSNYSSLSSPPHKALWSFVSLNWTLTCRAPSLRKFEGRGWVIQIGRTSYKECPSSCTVSFRYVEQSDCVLTVSELGLIAYSRNTL